MNKAQHNYTQIDAICLLFNNFPYTKYNHFVMQWNFEENCIQKVKKGECINYEKAD